MEVFEEVVACLPVRSETRSDNTADRLHETIAQVRDDISVLFSVGLEGGGIDFGGKEESGRERRRGRGHDGNRFERRYHQIFTRDLMEDVGSGFPRLQRLGRTREVELADQGVLLQGNWGTPGFVFDHEVFSVRVVAFVVFLSGIHVLIDILLRQR